MSQEDSQAIDLVVDDSTDGSDTLVGECDGSCPRRCDFRSSLVCGKTREAGKVGLRESINTGSYSIKSESTVCIGLGDDTGSTRIWCENHFDAWNSSISGALSGQAIHVFIDHARDLSKPLIREVVRSTSAFK